MVTQSFEWLNKYKANLHLLLENKRKICYIVQKFVADDGTWKILYIAKFINSIYRQQRDYLHCPCIWATPSSPLCLVRSKSMFPHSQLFVLRRLVAYNLLKTLQTNLSRYFTRQTMEMGAILLLWYSYVMLCILPVFRSYKRDLIKYL